MTMFCGDNEFSNKFGQEYKNEKKNYRCIHEVIECFKFHII
jgi:hypothetical protein